MKQNWHDFFLPIYVLMIVKGLRKSQKHVSYTDMQCIEDRPRFSSAEAHEILWNTQKTVDIRSKKKFL